MDHNVPFAITAGLRRRGVDCLSAAEDDATRLTDPELLQRASTLGRVLFTMDDDLLVIAAAWMGAGTAFSGVVYAHPLRITIAQAICDLDTMGHILDPADIASNVEHLPL
jgi:hypothetical protein